jgi:site-specific recombinase XerD
MMLGHESALIATTGYQMTASSPRGTFSQAELTAERVITRCITRSMSAPRATIPAMPGDLEPLPASGTGPAAVAAELTGRIRAELPVISDLGEREQILLAAWLTGLRSARTRRAYAGDAVAWLGWLADRDTDVLAAGRVHVDLWAATWLDNGAAASSVRRRLSALSSFYRYCAAHDLTGRIPTQGVARPAVDPDYTATVGLDRDQARALVAAADADAGAQALRTAAVVRLLLHNALRVDEACAADVADLGEDSGHRVLRVVRKGARKAKIPLTPATVAALEAYLAARAATAEQAGVGEWRQLSGPLLATAAGGRLRQGHLWELVRRLARTAGIGAWEQLSPHCLRHSAITFALDAGASLRDVQDYAGHKDPRTTRRYDHSRDNLDRNAAYTVAAYLA